VALAVLAAVVAAVALFVLTHAAVLAAALAVFLGVMGGLAVCWRRYARMPARVLAAVRPPVRAVAARPGQVKIYRSPARAPRVIHAPRTAIGAVKVTPLAVVTPPARVVVTPQSERNPR
jgi:hypothetical protein